jgi:hypothetical protein
VVFKELSPELLDLVATEKGYRAAVYAMFDDGGGSSQTLSSLSSSLTTCELCCT